jgi:hypothetical protein
MVVARTGVGQGAAVPCPTSARSDPGARTALRPVLRRSLLSGQVTRPVQRNVNTTPLESLLAAIDYSSPMLTAARLDVLAPYECQPESRRGTIGESSRVSSFAPRALDGPYRGLCCVKCFRPKPSITPVSLALNVASQPRSRSIWRSTRDIPDTRCFTMRTSLRACWLLRSQQGLERSVN